jgi:hypothetical protein
LVQTRKVVQFPIVLLGKDFWEPLLTWVRTTMAGEGLVSEADIELLQVTDSVAEAVAIVNESRQRQGKS